MGIFDKAKNMAQEAAGAKQMVDEVTGKTKGKESEAKGKSGRSKAEQKRGKRGGRHSGDKGGSRK